MIIISNTSPIIYFAKTGKLEILKELYSIIYIPTEVWAELMSPITTNKEKIPPDIKYEIEAKEAGWLVVKDPEKEENLEIALNLTRDLGRGEAYAIALSLELSADFLLINDRNAKIIAESMGIKTKWIGEVLLKAAENQLIKNVQEFKSLFEKMIEYGLWIEKRYYNDILVKVQEFLKD